MELQEFFAAHPRAALAFSGGVDSAYLLYAAGAYGADVTAYYVRTAFQPEFEYQDALRLAGQLGARLRVLELDILSDPIVCANPRNRCYYCKQRIFSAVLQAAREDGLTCILDGTNASDDAGDRPGMQALAEMQVLSPLRLCGLTKEQVRRLSKEAGLFTWNKPSYACLATRIPAGTPITAADLRRTEESEDLLMRMGFSGLRLRLEGDAARLQLPLSQFPMLLEKREEILARLKGSYSRICLDLEPKEDLPACQSSESSSDEILELKCNLDDMTPEDIGFACEELLAAGALDVFTQAIGMKKNRPGTLLTVLCRREEKGRLAERIFRLTSTLGIRVTECSRCILERRAYTEDTRFGPVRCKESRGYGVCRSKPEYDDIAHIAREQGLSPAQVRGKISGGSGQNSDAGGG